MLIGLLLATRKANLLSYGHSCHNRWRSYPTRPTLLLRSEITFLHLELTGNAYWFIARNKKGQPVELWPLMPQQMAVVPDETHFIIEIGNYFSTPRANW